MHYYLKIYNIKSLKIYESWNKGIIFFQPYRVSDAIFETRDFIIRGKIKFAGSSADSWTIDMLASWAFWKGPI